MTIDELANVYMGDIDIETGEQIGHRAKYQRIIAKLGYEAVKSCIPYALDRIKEALPNDEYLNNLPIGSWDRAAGYVDNSSGNTSRIIRVGSALTALYTKAGVTSYSLSAGVCILKEAARMWAEE